MATTKSTPLPTGTRIGKIRQMRDRTVTISGLTHADLRTIANAVENGAFAGGDQGGPVSDALLRFAKHMRTRTMYESSIGDVTFTVSTSSGDDLYREVDPLGLICRD